VGRRCAECCGLGGSNEISLILTPPGADMRCICFCLPDAKVFDGEWT
jgi:hypothetical protein